MKQVFLLVCSCALLGCTSSVKNNTEINSDTFLLTGHIEGYKPAAEPLIGKIYYEELFTGKPLVIFPGLDSARSLTGNEFECRFTLLYTLCIA